MSLDSLVDALHRDELKFLFVGGKGGVGKTTSVSKALMVQCFDPLSSSCSVLVFPLIILLLLTFVTVIGYRISTCVIVVVVFFFGIQ